MPLRTARGAAHSDKLQASVCLHLCPEMCAVEAGPSACPPGMLNVQRPPVTQTHNSTTTPQTDTHAQYPWPATGSEPCLVGCAIWQTSTTTPHNPPPQTHTQPKHLGSLLGRPMGKNHVLWPVQPAPRQWLTLPQQSKVCLLHGCQPPASSTPVTVSPMLLEACSIHVAAASVGLHHKTL
jgi:hypothetical protein